MLKIHFLNVGHGDCTVIQHQDNRLTVIDINNGAELDLESLEELAKSYGLPISRTLENTLGGHGIEILSPTPEIVEVANKEGKTNNLSYILQLTYNGIKVILGGDAEAEVWEDLVKYYGKSLKCNILKASHHGRDSAYHQKAVELMKPDFTVVSVGKKPETDASDKYKQYSKYVWSTRWKGNITLTIDDYGKAIMSSEYNS